MAETENEFWQRIKGVVIQAGKYADQGDPDPNDIKTAKQMLRQAAEEIMLHILDKIPESRKTSKNVINMHGAAYTGIISADNAFLLANCMRGSMGRKRKGKQPPLNDVRELASGLRGALPAIYQAYADFSYACQYTAENKLTIIDFTQFERNIEKLGRSLDDNDADAAGMALRKVVEAISVELVRNDCYFPENKSGTFTRLSWTQASGIVNPDAVNCLQEMRTMGNNSVHSSEKPELTPEFAQLSKAYEKLSGMRGNLETEIMNYQKNIPGYAKLFDGKCIHYNPEDEGKAPEKDTSAAKQTAHRISADDVKKEIKKEKNSRKARAGKKTTLIYAAAAACIIYGVISGISGLRKLQSYKWRNVAIDASKYITLSCTGYSGYGTCSGSMDYAGLNAELAKSGRRLNDGDIYIAIDTDSGVSNGDIIKATASYTSPDDRENPERNVSVSGSIKSYTVSGLDEPAKADPFKNLDVSFSGISGKTAEIKLQNNSTDPFLKTVQYSSDISATDKNGSIVQVFAYCDEDAAAEYGEVLAADSKSYTVSGLSEYASAADLTDSALQLLIDENDSLIRSQLMGEDSEDNQTAFLYNCAMTGNDGKAYKVHYFPWWETVSSFTLKSVEPVGIYLITPKEGAGNSLVMMSKVTVTASEKAWQLYNDSETEYDFADISGNQDVWSYIPVYFENVTIDGAGNATYESIARDGFDKPQITFDRLYANEIDPKKFDNTIAELKKAE